VSESPHRLIKLAVRVSATESADNNEVPFVTNLLVLQVTNAGKFLLNMNFWLSFIEEETNKLLRTSNIFPFFIWTLANTQQTTFLESSYGRIQKMRSHSTILCNKERRTDVTWNIAAIPGQNKSVVSLITKNKTKYASDLENRVYHISNARTHVSYMLHSTTRKRTQRSWVVPYQMYLSPNIQSTFDTN